MALLLVAALFLLSGCGESEQFKRSAKAANWLNEYSKSNPPNNIWRAIGVGVEDDGKKVVLNVEVPPGQANMVRTRPRISQVQFAQLACPLKESQFWSILDRDASLWINLISGDDVLIGATCKTLWIDGKAR